MRRARPLERLAHRLAFRAVVRSGSVVLVGILSGASTSVLAQDPVPVGELAPVWAEEITLEVHGRCVDLVGRPLAGVDLEFSGADSSEVRRAHTDAEGHFLVVGLVPDRYTVRASLEGFATQVQEVTLAPGRTFELSFTFAGPVSTGEPRVAATPVPRDPSDGSSREPVASDLWRVQRGSFSDDLALDTWLRDLARQGWSLRSVIAEDPGTSLFALARAPRGDCLVLPDAWPVQEDRLARRLEHHDARWLAGVHRLTDATAALVLCTD